MILSGTVLRLGTVDKCNRMFTQDCDVTYEHRIPVVLNFDFVNLKSYLGSAVVTRNGDLFVITNEFHNEWLKNYLKEYGKAYVGGYYDGVITDVDKNGNTLIKNAHLCGISVIPPIDVADDSLYLVEIGC